jgi:hypothetical protein
MFVLQLYGLNSNLVSVEIKANLILGAPLSKIHAFTSLLIIKQQYVGARYQPLSSNGKSNTLHSGNKCTHPAKSTVQAFSHSSHQIHLSERVKPKHIGAQTCRALVGSGSAEGAHGATCIQRWVMLVKLKG